MIAPQRAPGLQPLSADFVSQQLNESPDIEVVGKIEPPRLLGLQSAENVESGSIVLACMHYDKAKQLRSQAGARLLVERDSPLTFGLDVGAPASGLANPGVVAPLGDGFETTLEVRGANGALAEAEVYLFGSVWPVQAVTDENGRAVLRILGETPDTIRALYIKPKVDYWGLWLARPELAPGETTTVTVEPLSGFLHGFPNEQLLGWGQRAMGLDLVPASYNGAGIKVAIIDSGAAQPTHRNLHRLGPGVSVVATDPAAWTRDTIGHGSHCAGVIAGGPIGSNSGGVRGFAPAAEIHIIQIFPGGKFSSLIQALDYCIENGIDVANLSLGGGEPSRIVEERLIKAKQMGTACIVAAGNSGGPVQFPASTPHVLAVSAIGKWGEFPAASFHATQALDGFESTGGFFPAKFSCFGPEVDVCAPGVAIVSSLPTDGFAAWDGTSMAAPHVTGMAALLLAHHPDFRGPYQARDARRVERLFELIKQSATPLSFGDPARTGAGLPNVFQALGLEARSSGTSASSGLSPDSSVAEMIRQLIEALRRGLPNLAREADAPRPQSADATPASILNSEEARWRNTPVARGAARTSNGSFAPQSADVGVDPRTLPPADAQFEALRSALKQAGLMRAL
ncbi:MAG TPA: S8 family serine peptidase [Roseiarcus sp.]|nr:S8 family serine peptidase [Roseiarcus sp.]